MAASSRTATEILDREFLEIRVNILEIGAPLDGVQRADGHVANDRRTQLLVQVLRILLEAEGDRAERIQLLFSRPYAPDWPHELGVTLR